MEIDVAIEEACKSVRAMGHEMGGYLDSLNQENGALERRVAELEKARRGAEAERDKLAARVARLQARSNRRSKGAKPK